MSRVQAVCAIQPRPYAQFSPTGPTIISLRMHLTDNLGLGCRSWLSGASDEEGSGSEGRVPSPPASDVEGGSLLDTVLLAEWEDRAEQGLFRYDVTACPTMVVPGAYGFVAQCNEGRGSKKRPTEFRVDQVRRCLAFGQVQRRAVGFSSRRS